MFTRVLDLQFGPAAVFKRLCKKIKNKYKSKTTISEDKKTVTVCGLDMQGRDQSVEVSLHSSRGIEFAISHGLVRDRLLPPMKKAVWFSRHAGKSTRCATRTRASWGA